MPTPSSLPSVLFIYPGQARTARLAEIETGEAPQDFFYGYPHIQGAGFKVAIGNSRQDPRGLAGLTLLAYERLRNRALNFGLASSRVLALADEISDHDMALSFNDFFSLSMGLYRHHIQGKTLLLGGFHGLSDLVDRVHPAVRGYARKRIVRAIQGLDHLYFSGEVDREVAIEMYGIPRDKTTYYPFGVDAEFWRPSREPMAQSGILSVGSDPSRDFDTLIQADLTSPVRIITRLKVAAPTNKPNYEIIQGSLFGSDITDVMLRDIYQKSQCVVVPLKDVWQPTGCSVSLQAMACGKPVIVSNIKGLWDQDRMKSGENCLLIPPKDPQALSEAIRALEQSPELRERIGLAARTTVEQYFSISRMNTALETMIRQQATALLT